MESATAEPAAGRETNAGAPQQHRRRRWWIVGAALAAVVVLALALAATWHFSSVVLVPDHQDWPLNVEVEGVKPGRVVLSSDHQSTPPGVYGLDWQTGHAIVGPVVSEGDGTVTRRLSDVRGYLVRGIHVGLDSHVYAGDPRQSLGLPLLRPQLEGPGRSSYTGTTTTARTTSESPPLCGGPASPHC